MSLKTMAMAARAATVSPSRSDPAARHPDQKERELSAQQLGFHKRPGYQSFDWTNGDIQCGLSCRGMLHDVTMYPEKGGFSVCYHIEQCFMN